MVFGDPGETLDLGGEGGADAAAVLDALGDAVSREILTAAAGTPVTVEDLAMVCDVSESTVYRRLDRLNTLGLVERCNPLVSETKGAYRTTMRGLYVAVDDSGIAVEADELTTDALAAAMRLVIDAVDVRRLSYDRDERTVDLTLSLADGDFETFLKLYADNA
ncbi:winged helix-turn-helix domain-containing protein [Salinigranum halophilum]|mgnify:CR=1 FL=1|jgi:DNA-binding transcriptional ArsR family regulator|uniref:winged helix-turn-helix domain-containing protein n=1 Tax=Salinigranum halophilum TaxID=2565931 RepID=UPI0010A807A7|nr:winged helix-turn-helix domain-containing protein [Salinigranum halophilum]